MSHREKRLERRRKWQRKMEVRNRIGWSEPEDDLPPGIIRVDMRISFDAMDGEFHTGKDLADILTGEDDRTDLLEMVNQQPAGAIPRLEELYALHPDCPVLCNWLGMAHYRIGNTNRFEQLARLNFQRHPEYLFARLDYIQACLERGEVDQATEVFAGKFHLKHMYPHRDVFHITELAAMCQVCTLYFTKLGMMDQAGIQLDMIEQVDPDGVCAENCRKLISRRSLPQAMAGLARRLLGLGRARGESVGR